MSNKQWNMQIINGEYQGTNYQYAPFVRIFNKNEFGESHIATVNLISGAYVSIPHAMDEKNNKERIENAQLIAAAPELLDALLAAKKMIDEALPKFNWGASFLDANAITLLNETPIKINAAIAKAKG